MTRTGSPAVASAGTSAAPKAGFRPDVQGLRAIAVLAVVVFHAGLPVPGGFVGVDVFFVISGFVITGMLRREWAATGRLNLIQFYVRRFMRLTPALALVVVFAALVSFFVLSPLGAQQVTAKTGLGAMLLSANFVIAKNTGGYFDVAAGLNPLLNLWSLSVEEQFYLVFPALLLGAWALQRRLRGSRPVAVAAIVVVGLASLTLAVISSRGIAIPLVPKELFGFYGPGGRVWEFAVGALIALAAHRLAIHSRRLAIVIGIVGLGLVGASLLIINGTLPYPGLFTLLPVGGTALLLVSGSHVDNVVTRLLASRPMLWVGDRSYSLYLWHWPLISVAIALWPGTVAAKAIAAVLSVIPAVLSYRYVETRFRRLRPSGRLRLARVVAVVMVPAVLVPGLLGFAASTGYWNPAVRSFQKTVDAHLLANDQCDLGIPISKLPKGKCVYNAAGANEPIYLVGDSNAGHFAEALVDASAELDAPLIASTTNGCPFVDGYVHIEGQFDASTERICKKYRTGMIDYLRTAKPGVVVISQVATYWSMQPAFIGADKDSATSDTQTKLDYYAERLPALVAELRAAGHRVLIVQQVPEFTKYEPQACSIFVIEQEACESTIPRADAEQQGSRVQAIIEAATSGDGAASLQLRDALCGPDSCSTTMDGNYNYRDSAHVSVAASHALAPRFVDAIRELLKS